MARRNPIDDIARVLTNASSPPSTVELRAAVAYNPYRDLNRREHDTGFYWLPMSAEAVTRAIAERDFQRRHPQQRTAKPLAAPKPIVDTQARIWTSETVAWFRSSIYAPKRRFDPEPWLALAAAALIAWFFFT